MKLILRAPNWVGDAVMAIPAVDAAREMTGADLLAVMARPATAPLFANRPQIDRVIVIDDRISRVRGPFGAAKLIREDRYDVGVIFPPSFSSALIFRLGGVKERIGFPGDSRSWLLSRAIKPPKDKLHRARQYLYLLEQLTGRGPLFHHPHLHLSDEDVAGGNDILRAHGLTYDDRYVVIAPQAVAPSRRWGTDNYGKLALSLAEKHACRVVLIGTGRDASTGDDVRHYAPNSVVNLCGLTDLLAAAAIISFAKLFVGNDSGLAHVAAAVGCPLVVLSGPDDPEETSPLSEKKKVIIKDIECIRCVRNICPKSGDDLMRCMKLITVEEVADAAQALVAF
jgi:heptosyltransferase-2